MRTDSLTTVPPTLPAAGRARGRPSGGFLRALLIPAALFAPVFPSTASLAAQEDPFLIPGTNPPAVVQERVAATDIRVDYHRPRMKGRTVFGALVPWDQVWRTGADNATRISFSRPVRLNGVAVPAGEFELFTIPGRDSWTVIIHEHRSQWGSYSYDPSNDVARLSATPRAAQTPVESFTIAVEDVQNSRATLVISWEETRVPIDVEVDVAALIPEVEAQLQRAATPPYFRAAMFYWENGLDIQRAAELITLAVAASPAHIGILHRQALILADAGDTDGALRAARASMEGAQIAGPELRAEYTRLNRALIQRLGG